MKVAILGGGVAGLATAIALRQCDSAFGIEVFERHETTTQIGAGVVCWPNASFVLDQLGVLEKIESVSRPVTKMERQTRDGQALGALDIRQLDQRMGYPSLAVLRRDLMRILVDRLEDLGISVNYGCEAASIDATREGAKVLLRDGSSIEADCFLGADGRMSSLARDYVQQGSPARYQGFINWIGVYEGAGPGASGALFPEAAVKDYWGVGQRFGIVPVSEQKAYWAGGAASPAIGSRYPSSYKAELEQIFDGWPAPIPTLIRDSEVSSINKIFVHDLDPILVWHRDNVLLVGDAAHAALPTSGQGACQALEDAWHLSRLLEDHRPGGSCDLAVVFDEFTELRREKTAGITAGGRHLARSLFETDPEACSVRNANSLATDYDAAVAGMARGWASGLPIGGLA